ncbi:MAG: BamA/TamA family outer membrane protein [Gemmatimonadaceae bacterium]
MRIFRLLAPLLAIAAQPGAALAQSDAPQDTTIDLGVMLGQDASGGLSISSGKTYNRVEGLPILFGPTYKGSVGDGRLSVSALGIIRSADDFYWDAGNIGHRLSADLRFGRLQGFAVGAESFDVVSKIEPWQLSEPDGGLAAFFLKRDYFDFFGRHGARAHVSAFRGNTTVTLGLSDVRWSSRRERKVHTLFRGSESWRENPSINDGRAHVFDISLRVDTRNSEVDPSDGWLLTAQYEHGAGDFETTGTSILPTLPDGRARLAYGRSFVDLRRYNRISQRRRLHARLVLGGWLHGDDLPYQRRFSVGGIGTLPGFDFRRTGIGTDVGQCGSEATISTARPAECERFALAQVEYRQELVSELIDMFNRNGVKVRGAAFRVKPDLVAFADAGRGWLVGPREGTLRYGSRSLPGFDTFRTDVGIGIDLGIAGLYVAKAVSEPKEPANFFIRLRNRF